MKIIQIQKTCQMNKMTNLVNGNDIKIIVVCLLFGAVRQCWWQCSEKNSFLQIHKTVAVRKYIPAYNSPFDLKTILKITTILKRG